MLTGPGLDLHWDSAGFFFKTKLSLQFHHLLCFRCFQRVIYYLFIDLFTMYVVGAQKVQWDQRHTVHDLIYTYPSCF